MDTTIDIDLQHEEESWGKIFARELARDTFLKFTSYWWENYYSEISTYISRKLGNFIDPQILEAGSGSGKASILVGNKCSKVTLLDISENALKYAKFLSEQFGANNVSFVRGNIFHLPFEEKTFDLTWNIGVLEHYNEDQILAILKEMSRVTKNGGHISFGVPNFFSGPIIKAWILSKKFFKWIPGYRLDSEKFYSEKKLIEIVNRLGNKNLQIQNLEINYFGSFLPMESPKFLIRMLHPLNKILKRNKFLTFISFNIKK